MQSDQQRDSLLYELVPVLLDKVPGEQVASEAVTHSSDDQWQLLCLDILAQKPRPQNPAGRGRSLSC